MRPSPRAAWRMQAGAWAALLLVGVAALIHATHFDAGVAFLPTGDGPTWISAPPPQSADLIALDPANPPQYVFMRRFDAAGPSSGVWLRGRALRDADAELNGQPLELTRRGGSWRSAFEADLGPRLRSGRNELRISVTHPHGPGVLQAELILPNLRIETGPSWTVTGPATRPIGAWQADDRAVHAEALQMPTPAQIAADRAVWLLALFVLSAVGFWICNRGSLRGQSLASAPSITLVAISLFWIWAFLDKFWSLPTQVGFDLPAHLAYIEFLQEKRSLPTADYGFSTYHPPAFYILAASLHSVLQWISGDGLGPTVHRLIPFVSGLSNVWLTAWTAKRLWPEQVLRPCLATAAAGLMPMNLYMSAYVSNEPFQAAVISACLAGAAGLLLSDRVRPARWVLLSLGMGLAILTKFTSLILAPVIAFFVSLRLWWVDGKGPGRSVLALFALLAGSAAVGGWFYIRNALLFGDPFVWNLDVPGAMSWWLRPGFHTAAWYSSFGQSLVHPYFSAYASFWDGVYSTLWGDGLAGGMIRLGTRHGLWNDDFQTLVYPLALPATALLALGYLRLWLASFREGDPGRRLLFALITTMLGLLAFSLIRISLELPFYAQAKAFYILPGLLPLSLVAAEGLAAAAEWCKRRNSFWLAAAYFGWLGTLAGAIALTYLA